MLLRLKIRNFLSFHDETVFDMFPNQKRENFTHHIYAESEIPLLKLAAIYGANGSGKSNFLEAVKILREIVVNKDFLKTFPIQLKKFRLGGPTNTDPICFSVEFLSSGKYYKYSVEINNTEIDKEELHLSGLGKKNDELLFRRERTRVVTPLITDNSMQEFVTKFLKTNRLSSLMALNKEFPLIDSKSVMSAQAWFENNIRVLTLQRTNPALISILSNNNELLKFTNEIFKKIGLGISNIDVDEQKLSAVLTDENEQTKQFKEELIKRLESGIYTKLMNDKVIFNIETINGEQIVKRLLIKHIGESGFENNLEIETQSDGTVRMLNLIPALYEIKNRECVYFIDEIESSIHPTLMISLIKYFSNLDTKGQLIFSTHETELLNQKEIMRPDEVWFSEKIDGNTKMYSLNDFKLHNTLNIKNGYLEGRYGAIPFIGNLDE